MTPNSVLTFVLNIYTEMMLRVLQRNHVPDLKNWHSWWTWTGRKTDENGDKYRTQARRRGRFTPPRNQCVGCIQISLVPHDAPLSEITPKNRAVRPGEEESSPGSYDDHSKGEKLKATHLQVSLYTYLLLATLCCSVLFSTSRVSASFSKWTTAKFLPSPYSPLNTYICILRWIQSLTSPQTCLCRSDHSMEDYTTKSQSMK